MRILIAALHAGYYRNLEPVVEALADRGHEVFLGTERKESAGGGQSIVDRLAEGRPNVRVGVVPHREKDDLFIASKVRLSLDYLRYLDPAYGDTAALRQRAVVRTPTGAVRLAHGGVFEIGRAHV